MRANRVRERDAARKGDRGLLLHAAHGYTSAVGKSGASRTGRGYAAATFERERQRRLKELRAKRDALERQDCSFPAALPHSATRRRVGEHF